MIQLWSPDKSVSQFLPQDKVSEFAKLTPPALLKATERAIEHGHLLTRQEVLTEKNRALMAAKKVGCEIRSCCNAQNDQGVENEEARLEALNKRQSDAEHDVARFRERQQHLENVRSTFTHD